MKRFGAYILAALLAATPANAQFIGTSGTAGASGANPTGTAGPAAVNGSATTFMRSDGAPAIQKATSGQFGIVEVDGTTITAAGGVITSVGGATGANPTATAGPAANNGVAATFMRSDASPAVQKASAAQFGIAECDNSTITCPGGVMTAVTGAVSSVSGQSGVSTSPTTGAVVVSGVATLCNSGANITGTTYTVNLTAPGDLGSTCNFTGTSASAWTLGSPVYKDGFNVANNGTATITITASGNINGNATLAITAGQSASIYADPGSTTWWAAIANPTGGGGSGTVTSVGTGAGLTGGTITTSGTISTTYLIRAVTGTTDTILSTDAAKLVTYNNASAVAVALPQATGSFAAGFALDVQNLGVGTVTITPTTSTINGASTLTINTNRGCSIVSDGTNYQVSSCNAIGAGSGTVTTLTAGTNITFSSGATCTSTCTINASGGGGGGSGLDWTSRCSGLGAGHNYCPVSGYLSASQGSPNTISSPVVNTTTITKLYVTIPTAPGTGNSEVYTLIQNGTTTAITCTISGASATTCTDTGHSVTPSAGDLFAWDSNFTGSGFGNGTAAVAIGP